jgi:preprotein translocase subunit SecE
MGKVKDGASAPAPAKASGKGGSGGQGRGGGIAAFVANLARADRYKPLQGRHARLGTAIGLGAVVVLGLVQLYEQLADYPKSTQLAVPAVVGLVLGWLVYRVVEFPPFVEFLIATEAEMNKVSWTSKDELKRATAVVLVTVALMAVFLFGVDFVWQFLLKMIGVLRFGNTSDLGSNA